MWTERIQQEYLEIFRSLLRFDTTNPPGYEKDIAQYIHRKLTDAGIESHIVGKTPNRANVLARISGSDPSAKPLMLISHIDVVEADDWSVPAFSAYEKDGILYGRGTIDTKQLTAGQLMAMLLMARSGRRPHRDVILIAAADEENGSNYGMAYLTENYPEWFPEAYVWSEGGGFIVHNGEKQYRLCAGSEKSTLCVRICIDPGAEGAGLEGQTLYYVARVLEKLTSYTPSTTLTSATERFCKILPPEEIRDPTIRNLWEYSTKCSMQLNEFHLCAETIGCGKPVELFVSFKLLPTTPRREIEDLFAALLCGEPATWEVTDFQEGYESSFDNEFIDVLDSVSKQLDPETQLLPMMILGSTDGRFIGGNVYGYTPLLRDMPFSTVLQLVHGKDEHITLDSAVYNGRVICEAAAEFAYNKTGG